MELYITPTGNLTRSLPIACRHFFCVPTRTTVYDVHSPSREQEYREVARSFFGTFGASVTSRPHRSSTTGMYYQHRLRKRPIGFKTEYYGILVYFQACPPTF